MTVPNYNAIVSAVQKKFGSESMTLLPDNSQFGTVTKFISFGHWAMDKAVSGLAHAGGVPVGRLTEIFGAPSSGKSLLVAHLIAECQKAGGIAILDDTEHAYMKEFGDIVGVDNDKLLYSASTTVEEVFDKMEFTLKTILATDPNVMILYAWDSLALVSSMAEMEKELLDDKGGYNVAKAKVINAGVRKVVSLIGKYNVALVITNQTRQNIGVMFGDKETTPGGDAVPFWASVRIRLSRKELIRNGPTKEHDVIGVKGEAVIRKNKVAAPFKSCKYEVYFDHGVAWDSGMIELLLKEQVIHEESKGWYTMKGQTGKYTKNTLEKFFAQNPEQLAVLYEE